MATPAGPGRIAVFRALANEIGSTIEVPDTTTVADLRRLSDLLGKELSEGRV